MADGYLYGAVLAWSFVKMGGLSTAWGEKSATRRRGMKHYGPLGTYKYPVAILSQVSKRD